MSPFPKTAPIKSLLIANRGEIAIRVMRAATELGIRTIAIHSQEDRFSLHRTKADESYLVGAGRGPVDAYLDIGDIIRIALEAEADAVHPGYGFLSESPEFAEACAAAGIAFVGPLPDTMRRLGNKVEARNLAEKAGVPVMPASPPLPAGGAEMLAMARAVGFPAMLKASWGGGGRGMRIVEDERELDEIVAAARREAKAAFGKDEVYLEKLIRRARHVEVQILGDAHGNLVHLYERDCTVQRRNQKVVERAPAAFLADAERRDLCEAALKIGRAVDYRAAGTVEFLQDADTGKFYFIEVNPRIQVEHTVTECVTGHRLGQGANPHRRRCTDRHRGERRSAAGRDSGQCPCIAMPRDDRRSRKQLRARLRHHHRLPQPRRFRYTARCRNGLRGRHHHALLRFVAGQGDGVVADPGRDHCAHAPRAVGVSHSGRGDQPAISRSSDHAPAVCIRRLHHHVHRSRNQRAAAQQPRIKGDVNNGNPVVKGRAKPKHPVFPKLPRVAPGAAPAGTKQKLDELGPDKFAAWMLQESRILLTDTSMRDAHQSLLATRFRTHDMALIAPYYASLLPQLFSVECWGGATFDVAMRFLREDPWARLAAFREAMPNLLLQMLFRSANAVGYTNYPDNVVKHFVKTAAGAGIDVFRVFDCLNWADNMRVAIEAVRHAGRLCEAAICYSGNLSNPQEKKYDLKYYVKIAKELRAMGAHVLAIKDMAGLCQPRAAAALVKALKEEVGLPVHFHTHDTSGIAAASVLAAIEAGVDAVDGAIDALSGLTSQPNLGSIVEALRFGPREAGLDADKLREISTYWEQVRRGYVAFESDIRAGASEVYVHGMPGGQYTNLREQARILGLDDHRWPEVARAYAEVNEMFGDIVKVTPTSKVVGDMAITMVTSGLTREAVLDPAVEIAFPDSVVRLFHGDLGQPSGGFPPGLQKKVLGERVPLRSRPGELLPAADLKTERTLAEAKVGRAISEHELASYLMYPKVFADYAADRSAFGDVSALPTAVFFYGMESGQEINVDLERGKTLIVRYVTTSDPHEDGTRTVFFELNGQPRPIRVADRSQVAKRPPRRKAEPGNVGHAGAPMPGTIATVPVHVGQKNTRQGRSVIDPRKR